MGKKTKSIIVDFDHLDKCILENKNKPPLIEEVSIKL